MVFESISLPHYGFLFLVMIMSFAVRGATGFGSGTVAVPLAALVVPIQIVIPVVSCLQLLSNTEFILRNWRSVVWREIVRIMPFATLGVALGLYLFYRLDARTIARGVGLFVVFYSIYVIATAGRDEKANAKLPSWAATASLNTAGGFIGALFGGASSPFYVFYLRALHLTRAAFRATMTTVILLQVMMRLGGYAGMGFVSDKVLLVTLIAIPFMMLGVKAGDLIAVRISPLTFNRMVGTVLLVSGIALILK